MKSIGPSSISWTITTTLLITGSVEAFTPLPLLRTTLSSTRTILSASTGIDEQCDVAIFGGGFGGLYTALALARQARLQKERLEIVLVDPSDRFVFLPLLYDLVVGTASDTEVCPTFQDLLQDTGIRHVRASWDGFTSPDLYSATISHPPTKNGGSDSTTGSSSRVNFRAAVISVGATPQSTLTSIPGAANYTQPFYTRENALETKLLLEKMERRIQSGIKPRIAIIGGGYGGVELAACVKRRLSQCEVSLLTRGAPMKGTRAEPLVQKALSRLGVEVEICAVQAILPSEGNVQSKPDKVLIVRTTMDDEAIPIDDNQPWDAVLWTAGSGPAYPVCDHVLGLKQVPGSGRIEVDPTLRCLWADATDTPRKPPIWALGDCSQIVDPSASFEVPKTAQAAIQQADVVAINVLADITGTATERKFQYQDLGSMLSLGGPNAAVLAPREDSALGPVFTTLLDTTRVGLDFADGIWTQLTKSPAGEKSGIGPLVENLGLSLGGYGLGVDTEAAPGTLSGTLSGAARRAIYSLRMPTNRQRAKSAVLGALSTAAALSKEIAEQVGKSNEAK